ncbi:4-amino-4-deoxy-L-arabinose transferase [Paenibacillus sp. CAA11]|uniref:ArnT family glycosyltransferase n=1 Tax=Paenibacillus sp. CAA11 TaxID=1532905 RepID=UPI000D364146|nr:glycosyltransferase family 39 protein [Paenibacillus sp. CAA11]AWB44500.1 4-amino-4-deoxy-L-arabinose transferase [Paenibacillus sp. CAA11]
MKTKWIKRIDVPLVAVMLLTAFLNGYNIWTEKYVNTYYTSAVASMLQSFHNFFFGTLDSGGFVTVDKPPVTFWIQTLFAWIFGLHGWSVILPQSLAGVGSVLLIYLLIRPSFGKTAARLAALAMALTPVAVAIARTNNIDSMLVFTLLLATWLLFRGVRQQKIWSTIGAFAMIGIAFNMKMLQAYMILPAFFVFYWLASKLNWKRKAANLVASTVVCALISVSWAVIVDSIPKDQRPYIGSSENNSVLELAFGYNGVSRLTGNQGGGGGAPGGSFERPEGGMNGQMPPDAPGDNSTSGSTSGQAPASVPNGQPSMMNGDNNDANTPVGGPNRQIDMNSDTSSGNGFTGMDRDRGGFAGGPGGNGGGGGGAFNTGTKGPLRLFQSSLSGQASWLLPFALIGCVGLYASVRRRNVTQKHKEALFWVLWLLPVAGFFSVAGFFHQYYLIMLAPPIAALVGTGWSEMLDRFKNCKGWTAWLLPAAVLITAVFQWYIVHPYDQVIGAGWSIAILVLGIAAALALVVVRQFRINLARMTALAALFILLIGPLYWAATPITYGQNSMIPAAGPTEGNGSMRGPGGENSSVDEELYSYLKEHNTGEKYLFAATDYTTAAPYIIEKGEKVISLGGFSGNDPVLSVERLEQMVNSGELKYFLISGGRGGNSEVTTWIQQHGTEISSDQWKGTSTAAENSSDNDNKDSRGMMDRFGGSATLYELTPGEGGDTE